MSDLRSKCVAAVASVLMTGAILLSLAVLAEAYGVYTWMDAAESLAAVSAMPNHPAIVTGSTHASIPARF